MKIRTNDQRLVAANWLEDQARQLENIREAVLALAIDNRQNTLEFFEAAHLADRAATSVKTQIDRLHQEYFKCKRKNEARTSA